MNAVDIIRLMKLEPHEPEGGWYRETYRGAVILPGGGCPGVDGPYVASTAILYLITPDNFSVLHRLGTDEVFHFYFGDPVRLVMIGGDGHVTDVVLGHDITAGHHVQYVVPAGTWQGLTVIDGGSFALMGTTVAPGFDMRDFECADRDALIAAYPRCRDLIAAMTRG